MTEHIDTHIQNLINQTLEDGRKLVTIRQITDIVDIPGADLIKKAVIEDGWDVVVKAGEFAVGDFGVFFEIDSFIQATDNRFAFLAKNKITWNGIEGYRLRTIRLRGQVSQGLILPLHLFPEITNEITIKFGDADLRNVREENFTGTVQVIKWDRPVSAQLQGKVKGYFPTFIPKTDQERAQNMSRRIFGYEAYHDVTPMNTDLIPEEALFALIEKQEIVALGGKFVDGIETPNFYRVHKAQASRDTKYEVSLKMDGSSMTVYVRNTPDGETKGVCSRNLELKLDDVDNTFVKTAVETNLLELIGEQGGDVALQGELMGPGIQGNRENLGYYQFFLYNIYDITQARFLNPVERKQWVEAANAVGKSLFGVETMIQHVPILHEAATLDELGIYEMADLIKFAEGPSLNNLVREGLVFKALDGSKQFKIISNEYLKETD